jgi:HemK-like putative methylase
MGQIRFAGVSLETLPGLVMTPRAASERLVEVAAARIGDAPARVADVGTGSGAIAVAIALAAPHAEVWATDVSTAATLLARANVHRHGLGERVHVVRGDLLASVPGQLDLIVANLPYLPRRERGRDPDLLSEPPDAVYADGDGLDPYRRLLSSAVDRLTDDGSVIVQLRREVFVAERDELAWFGERLANLAPARPSFAALPATA